MLYVVNFEEDALGDGVAGEPSRLAGRLRLWRWGMVTLSVAWVTIPSSNLQGGPCSHPPLPPPTSSHLGVRGVGLSICVGVLFPPHSSPSL